MGVEAAAGVEDGMVWVGWAGELEDRWVGEGIIVAGWERGSGWDYVFDYSAAEKAGCGCGGVFAGIRYGVASLGYVVAAFIVGWSGSGGIGVVGFCLSSGVIVGL